MKFVKDTISLQGTIDRLPFVLWGFALFAFKYNLNRLVDLLAFNEDWLITPYFIRPDRLIHLAFENAHHPLFVGLFLLSIPLLCLGVLLTYKRLKDIGLHPIFTLFFFFPWVNLPMLAVLGIIPGTSKAGKSEKKGAFIDRLIPQTMGGSAFVALGMLILFFVPIPMLSIPYTEMNMFFSTAWMFFLGLFSGLIYSHHTVRSLGSTIKAGLVSTAILLSTGFTVLVAGIFYLWITGQEEILFVIFGVGIYVIIPIVLIGFFSIPGVFLVSALGSTAAYYINRFLPFRTSNSIPQV